MNRALTCTDHKIHFSHESFWRKLHRHAVSCGRQLVEKSLWLYYAAQQPSTPAWAKAVMLGALGYLVFPADAVPDILPGAGYSDDLAVLSAAVATIIWQITPEVKRRTEAQLGVWFGEEQSAG